MPHTTSPASRPAPLDAADQRGGFTVADLIRVLAAYPAHARIVLSRDPEGNGYAPAGHAEPAIHTLDRFGHAELREPGGNTPTAVVIWPSA